MDALFNPDRALLKEVLGGQYTYREGGRQVLRQGAKGRRRSRKRQCSKDPCTQKVSGGRTDPSPKYRPLHVVNFVASHFNFTFTTNMLF